MYSARDEGVGEEEEQLTPAGTASSRTEKRQNNIYKTSLKLNLKNVLLTLPARKLIIIISCCSKKC